MSRKKQWDEVASQKDLAEQTDTKCCNCHKTDWKLEPEEGRGYGVEYALVNRKVAVAIWCCVFIITKIWLSPFEMATCNRHTHWRRTGAAQWLNEIPNKSIIDWGRTLKAALPLFNTCFRTFYEKRDKQWSLKLSVPGCALYSSGANKQLLSVTKDLTTWQHYGTSGASYKGMPRAVDVGIHAKITPEFIVKAS